MGYLDIENNYYEGDRQGVDSEVERRPSPSHVWGGDGWVSGPPDVPQSVSRFQARAALHLANFLDEVEAIMSHPDSDPLARLAWEDAQDFKRDSPTVRDMAQVLGLSESDLDHLFIVAARVDA